MKISKISIYKFSIPMHPFRIATGTMDYAQNLFIRIHTDSGLTGVGECSAFPMIAGETQATCYEMAKDFAAIWKNKNPLSIEERMQELQNHAAFNTTVKSAFDMALYDLAAQNLQVPLYHFLGGIKKELETDLTIGIEDPSVMAKTAIAFKEQGVRIIKIKLGKDGKQDIERVKQIRQAVGPAVRLRTDANQGWDFETAKEVLHQISQYDIEFCEQPMRYWNDDKLPALREASPVKIMADESVFDHHDAMRLIREKACDYINIKLAKSGGMLEATKIAAVCEKENMPCMMGGMLESRMALTAFAHFALAHDIIQFYDMDTCLLGHKADPVIRGVQFNGYFLDVPDAPGIGADVDQAFLKNCENVII